MGLTVDGRTFRRALQLLDGTMVSVEQGRVAFHNPSIEDYVRFHLDAGRTRFPELIGAVIHGEQLHRLVAAARLVDGAGILAGLRENEPALIAAVREMEEDLEAGLKIWRREPVDPS